MILGTIIRCHHELTDNIRKEGATDAWTRSREPERCSVTSLASPLCDELEGSLTCSRLWCNTYVCRACVETSEVTRVTDSIASWLTLINTWVSWTCEGCYLELPAGNSKWTLRRRRRALSNDYKNLYEGLRCLSSTPESNLCLNLTEAPTTAKTTASVGSDKNISSCRTLSTDVQRELLYLQTFVTFSDFVQHPPPSYKLDSEWQFSTRNILYKLCIACSRLLIINLSVSLLVITTWFGRIAGWGGLLGNLTYR